jgi:outer membrane lipoprotein-sorting protein
MKRIILIAIYISSILSLTIPVYSQNKECNTILDKIVAEYDNSKGVSANFNIITKGNGYNSEVGGKILLKDKMFSFKTAEMECGYDGETLWTYVINSEEINLSIPEEEEIVNINPYLLFKNYKERFKCSSTTKSGDYETILLTPKHTNDVITNIKVTINSKVLYPTKIEIENKDKTKVIISVSNYNKNYNLDNSKFIFNEKNYPNIEIIDLR